MYKKHGVSFGFPISSLITHHSSLQFKQRFTLIELLVVIAIIAILAAMLLPALNKARDTALGASCQGNLKTIGTARDMYTDTFDEWVLPYKAWDQKGRYIYFFQVLSGYNAGNVKEGAGFGAVWEGNGVKGTFACPGEKRKVVGRGGTDVSSELAYAYTHYGQNSYYHAGLGGYSGKGTMSKMRKISATFNPAVCVSIADNQRPGSHHFNDINWQSFRHGSGSGTEDSRRAASNSFYPYPGNNARSNISFADGHVAATPFGALYNIPYDSTKYPITNDAGATRGGASQNYLGNGYNTNAGTGIPGL